MSHEITLMVNGAPESHTVPKEVGLIMIGRAPASNIVIERGPPALARLRQSESSCSITHEAPGEMYVDGKPVAERAGRLRAVVPTDADHDVRLVAQGVDMTIQLRAALAGNAKPKPSTQPPTSAPSHGQSRQRSAAPTPMQMASHPQPAPRSQAPGSQTPPGHIPLRPSGALDHSMVDCPSCGHENSAEYRFCGQCCTPRPSTGGPGYGTLGGFQSPNIGNAATVGLAGGPIPEFDTAATATIFLGLPWAIFSFFIVAGVVQATGGTHWTAQLLGCLVFLASSIITFYPPTEQYIARFFFRVRRPSTVEKEKLGQVWRLVAERGNVDPEEYSLWVEDADSVNAFAAAGHIVCVTRRALHGLPTNDLAAVLAHELGHHKGGHARATLLMYWLSLPGRAVWRFTYLTYFWGSYVMTIIGSMFDRMGIFTLLMSLVLRFFPFVMLALLFFMAAQHAATFVIAITLLFVPPLLAWFGRKAELAADRAAAEMGFGDTLLDVLRGWHTAGDDDHRREAGLKARVLATHPSLAVRIAQLEELNLGSTR